jgi:hypothetical protein
MGRAAYPQTPSTVFVDGNDLAAKVALRFDVERIDGLTCGHEQSVSLTAAKAKVCAAFRQRNAHNQRTVRSKDGHAIMTRTTGETTPDIAFGITTNAIGKARCGCVNRTFNDDVTLRRKPLQNKFA